MMGDVHADPVTDIEHLLQRLLDRSLGGLARARVVDELAGWWDRSGGIAEPVLDRWLRDAVTALGRSGWRRTDVEQVVGTRAPPPVRELAGALESGVGPWRVRARLGAGAAVVRVVALRVFLGQLGSLPFVTEADAATGVAPVVLAKVRALLAKAESTTFDAEADALVAKAHELMVRHAIDRAVVDGGSRRGEVCARRVVVDDPYARAKFVLLSRVAQASSCQAVLSGAFGLATVFGYSGDLDAVEVLYTSLLLQATAGVAVARPCSPGSGSPAASTVAAFRRSWLLAFAHRIGERLEQASTHAVADAEITHGRALAPVLAAKVEAVEAAMREAAPRLRSLRAMASSGDGWAAGRAAADRATLAGQAPLPTRPPALER